MSTFDRFDVAALLLRASLGIMFIAHAALKYFVFTPAGTEQFFVSLGLPGALAYVVTAGEFFGGVALVAGLYSRAVAAALVPVLLGATWVHAGNGWLFTAPNGGWEYPAFLTVAALVVALTGGGRLRVGTAVGDAALPGRLGERAA